MGDKRPLDLSAGAQLVLNGQEWDVASFLPHLGRVHLRNTQGQELATTVRVLINHPDCRPIPGTGELPAYDPGTPAGQD